jgi:hypothetical protein
VFARKAIAIVAVTAVAVLATAFSFAEPSVKRPRPGAFGYLVPALQERPDCLLPYAAGGLDPAIQESLKALANAMDAPSPADGDSEIPAGITYLGQFIAHDISFDATSQATRVIQADAIDNLRSPGLNLDSLYGRGPLDQPYLYERVDRSERAGPRLLFGHRLHSADLARDTAGHVTGRALIGDPRNDDNLIVSQLHLAFVRFHNAVVARLAPGIADPYELFIAASDEVRRHYQWIVLHEFLPAITDRVVLSAAMGSACNEFCGPRGPFMPVEFSMGAFRFGHSMVRPFYTITAARIASLEQMRHEFTFRNPLSAGMKPGWEVDWRKFFWRAGARPTDANLARKIDTHVTPGLPTEISLLKAYAARVPSGQCVAESLGVSRLTREQLRNGGAAAALPARDGILLERTPLWYYVLREAEVYGHGERLGPLGSRLVADVLVNLVRAEPGSILTVPGWRPMLGPRGGEFTMLDLLCAGASVSPCQ